MALVPSHSIARPVLEEKTQNTREFVEGLEEQLPERPELLSVYARSAIELAAGVVALELGEDPVAWLRRSARASALLFASVSRPGEACSIELDDERTLTVTGPGDPSRAAAPDWVEAMWCALACQDPVAQHWLAVIDAGALQPEGVRFNAYVLPYAGFLRSLVTRDGAHSSNLEEAIEHCEPSSAELDATQDWIDDMDYPALRCAYFVLANEAGEVAPALRDLLERHRRHWESSNNRLAVQGLLSLRACTLRRLAADRGTPVDLASRYMPDQVWQAKPPQGLNACPYCVSPKPPDAARCALCGRDTTKDAPLELRTDKFSAERRRPCTRCAHPLHALANTCPRCRTQQR